MKSAITAVLATATLLACTPTVQPATAHNTRSPVLTGEWLILRIDGQAVHAPGYRLSFDADGQRFSAHFGCNRLFGGYSHQGDRLHFGPIAGTKMACPGNRDEERGKAALAAITHARTDAVKAPGLRLSLRDARDAVRLEAQAIAP